MDGRAIYFTAVLALPVANDDVTVGPLAVQPCLKQHNCSRLLTFTSVLCADHASSVSAGRCKDLAGGGSWAPRHDNLSV